MASQWDKMEGRPTKPVARSKVARSSGLRPTKVIISIRPGPSSPAQKVLFKKFFVKLISEVKKELSPNQAPAEDAPTGGVEESSSHE